MIDQISAMLREVAATVVMPRFQVLSKCEVMEKASGDIVTIVDHEAEAMITPRLLGLRPGSRVVERKLHRLMRRCSTTFITAQSGSSIRSTEQQTSSTVAPHSLL